MSSIYHLEGLKLGKVVVLGVVGPQAKVGYQTEIDVRTSYESGYPEIHGTGIEVVSHNEIDTFPFTEILSSERTRYGSFGIGFSPARGILGYLPDIQPEGDLIVMDQVIEGLKVAPKTQRAWSKFHEAITSGPAIAGFGLGVLSDSLPKKQILRSALGVVALGWGLNKLLSKNTTTNNHPL